MYAATVNPSTACRTCVGRATLDAILICGAGSVANRK
jgi:hypothetical protein